MLLRTIFTSRSAHVRERVELDGDDDGEKRGGLVESRVQDGLPGVEEGRMGGVEGRKIFEGRANSAGRSELEAVIFGSEDLLFEIILDDIGAIGEISDSCRGGSGEGRTEVGTAGYGAACVGCREATERAERKHRSEGHVS